MKNYEYVSINASHIQVQEWLNKCFSPTKLEQNRPTVRIVIIHNISCGNFDEQENEVLYYAGISLYQNAGTNVSNHSKVLNATLSTPQICIYNKFCISRTFITIPDFTTNN